MLILFAAIAPTGATTGASSIPSPPSRRMLPALQLEQKRACIAGAVGALAGLASTPSVEDPLAGRVYTAEAWRRRVKGKRAIPLIVRSPTILTYAVFSYSLAEYVQALPRYGPTDSLQQVLMWRLGQSALLVAAERTRGARDQVVRIKKRLLPS